MQEAWVQSLGWDDPLEKVMATCFSILAWKIHGQRSQWGRKESDRTEQRRGCQRMGWPDGIINAMDMSLVNLWETVRDRQASHAAVRGVKHVTE